MTDFQKDTPLQDRLNVLHGDQEERLARHRAETLGLPYISLLIYPLNPDQVELLPRGVAVAAKVILFHKQGKDVRLAVVNPQVSGVAEVVDELTKRFGVKPQVHIMSQHSYAIGLSRYRPERINEDKPQDEMRVTAEEAAAVAAVTALHDVGEEITRQSPTEMLTTIMGGAVALGASDVHIEAKEKESRLRYRIDGVLQDVTSFAFEGYKLLLSRVKVLSKLKINIHDIPQDGSFVLRIGKEIYDIRVSTLPGGFGENIVMRLLNRASEIVAIADLGMKERDRALVIRELARSNGMILATGPTGSGKTTSLAAFINEINNPEFKIITLEDPIEYRLPGVEQTQIEEEQGYTFARGLRAILRQDPDVILVGEMRDAETAETAVHASLTGHLVFSTLHTNDAPGAITRLIDMGIKPFVLAPAINLVIAQRLARVVCAYCAEEYPLTDELCEEIKRVMTGVVPAIFNPASLKEKSRMLVRAKGCAKCNHTGYKGRRGLFEIMSIDGEMEELVLKGATGQQLAAAARKQGMTTILQDGYLKVLEKTTTIEEVRRVTEE